MNKFICEHGNFCIECNSHVTAPRVRKFKEKIDSPVIDASDYEIRLNHPLTASKQLYKQAYGIKKGMKIWREKFEK